MSGDWWGFRIEEWRLSPILCGLLVKIWPLVRVNGEAKALAWGTTLKMLAGQAKTVTLRRFRGKKVRSVAIGGDEVEYR